MAAQSYANHVYRPVAWSLAWGGSVIAAGLLLWDAAAAASLRSIALALLGLVTVVTVTQLRQFALRLQNRIIRLEMQVRLARLRREEALPRLTMAQVVALRFASDAEMPALIDRAIAETMTPDQIKRAVKDWQGDFLRT